MKYNINNFKKQITWKYCSAEDGSVRSVNTETFSASELFFSADSKVLQSEIYNSPSYNSMSVILKICFSFPQQLFMSLAMLHGTLTVIHSMAY